MMQQMNDKPSNLPLANLFKTTGEEGMRIASYLIASMLAVLATPVFAGNVAVADSQAAIMATDMAKKTFEKLNNDMKPQRDRLEQLRKDISTIEE